MYITSSSFIDRSQYWFLRATSLLFGHHSSNSAAALVPDNIAATGSEVTAAH